MKNSKKASLEQPCVVAFVNPVHALFAKVTEQLPPDADQAVQYLKMYHFYCSAMTKNTVTALNQLRKSYNTAGELEKSPTKINLHPKYFQKELNATKGRTKDHGPKWHCIHDDHSSTDYTTSGITSHKVIFAEQCRCIVRGKMF